MKKFFLLLVMGIIAAVAMAQQQSLGDIARANRAKKNTSSATVRLDDDTLPRNPTPSTSSVPETKKTDAKTADAKDADTKDADAKDAPKKDTAAAQKQKNDELQKQIESQKKEVAALQRELDLAQREARLRAAAFYGDAGTQLRDQGKFAEDTRKEADEINNKKLALDAAQQKLTDLQEQARKAGLPSE